MLMGSWWGDYGREVTLGSALVPAPEPEGSPGAGSKCRASEHGSGWKDGWTDGGVGRVCASFCPRGPLFLAQGHPCPSSGINSHGSWCVCGTGVRLIWSEAQFHPSLAA